jgi:hypothetical protein
LANQLATIGKGVDDEDLISYVVGGLTSSYHPFITTLSFITRTTTISFDDFQTKLINYEQLLDTSQKSIQPKGGQLAFFTHKNKPQYPKQYSNKKSKFQSYHKQPNQAFQQSSQHLQQSLGAPQQQQSRSTRTHPFMPWCTNLIVLANCTSRS